jgi:hypothetical protein
MATSPTTRPPFVFIGRRLPGGVAVIAAEAKRPATNNRLFVNAVIYRYRTGIHSGTCRSITANGSRRRGDIDGGARAGCLPAFSRRWRPDTDNEFMMIDATIFRAHQHRRRPKKDGENQAVDRSLGDLTTKIHAVIDALGNPVALSLKPGAGNVVPLPPIP